VEQLTGQVQSQQLVQSKIGNIFGQTVICWDASLVRCCLENLKICIQEKIIDCRFDKFLGDVSLQVSSIKQKRNVILKLSLLCDKPNARVVLSIHCKPQLLLEEIPETFVEVFFQTKCHRFWIKGFLSRVAKSLEKITKGAVK
jgi:hypothetical protein